VVRKRTITSFLQEKEQEINRDFTAPRADEIHLLPSKIQSSARTDWATTIDAISSTTPPSTTFSAMAYTIFGRRETTSNFNKRETYFLYFMLNMHNEGVLQHDVGCISL
jgi:hypothetical protein